MTVLKTPSSPVIELRNSAADKLSVFSLGAEEIYSYLSQGHLSES